MFNYIVHAFQTLRKQIMGKFRSEKDKMPLDKKAMVLTQFPRFLSILEEELFATNSPIWDPEFRQVSLKPDLETTNKFVVKKGSFEMY